MSRSQKWGVACVLAPVYALFFAMEGWQGVAVITGIAIFTLGVALAVGALELPGKAAIPTARTVEREGDS